MQTALTRHNIETNYFPCMLLNAHYIKTSFKPLYNKVNSTAEVIYD